MKKNLILLGALLLSTVTTPAPKFTVKFDDPNPPGSISHYDILIVNLPLKLDNLRVQ